MTIQDLINSAETALAPVSDSARLDAQVLLAHALGKSRAFLFAHGEDALPDGAARSFAGLLARRLSGEPVAYILGEREFWSMSLKVTPDTLIPRPETERLVELALDAIDANKFRSIVDLGTGSGAIALAIAKERPDCAVTATDVRADTLSVAEENGRRIMLSNIEFVQSDWTEALSGRRFDLVVANPPYVARGDDALAALSHEPICALQSGADGLDDIRRLVTGVPAITAAGGELLLEHGFDQDEAVRTLLVSAGWQGVRTWLDYAGKPRISGGRLR